MDPDLFRTNINQFLQTARTVTFIIQKHKDTIEDFTTWYRSAVQQPWASDKVMVWAKNARNTIEKEGDLELNSTLLATLLFSYLSEEDLSLNCGRSELLHGSVKKLIRVAQKMLPSGVSDAAVVKIERQWITASLPTHELLQALSYVYARVFECCDSLARHLGDCVDKSVPRADAFDEIGESARQVHYVKLKGLTTSILGKKPLPLEHGDKQLTPAMRAGVDQVIANTPPQTSLDAAFAYYTMMAELTFTQFGNHMAMLFLLDNHWRPIKMLGTEFADQADKFIFWRYVADLCEKHKASGVVWISESWLRTVPKDRITAVRNMPIIGERLHVLAIDRSGTLKQARWEIVRLDEKAKPSLKIIEPNGDFEEFPSYLIPVTRTFGIDDPAFLNSANGRE